MKRAAILILVMILGTTTVACQKDNSKEPAKRNRVTTEKNEKTEKFSALAAACAKLDTQAYEQVQRERQGELEQDADGEPLCGQPQYHPGCPHAGHQREREDVAPPKAGPQSEAFCGVLPPDRAA